MSDLTHFDKDGNAIMVDVSDKPVTTRVAVATGKIYVCQEIFERIQKHEIAKGDVLGVARLAGIMATKRTSELIPLCHPLPLTKCEVNFELKETENKLYYIEAICLAKTATSCIETFLPPDFFFSLITFSLMSVTIIPASRSLSIAAEELSATTSPWTFCPWRFIPS